MGSNTQYILGIYTMIKTLLFQPLSSKSKKSALDLQVRFRIFNLALTILSAMRLYSGTFKDFSDTIGFQYQAYVFIWQYFGSKNKFCTRSNGELIQNDIRLLKETLALLDTDANMILFCADAEAAVNGLNQSLSKLHGCKGVCHFSPSGIACKSKEIYRMVQSPVHFPGNLRASIDVQEMPPTIDLR